MVSEMNKVAVLLELTLYWGSCQLTSNEKSVSERDGCYEEKDHGESHGRMWMSMSWAKVEEAGGTS